MNDNTPDSTATGFSVYEVPLDDDTPMYDAETLRDTAEADKYRSNHRVEYEPPTSYGYISINMLEFLKGKPWDQAALNYVMALEPTCIRVTEGPTTADAVTGRVTVYLNGDNRTIHHIQKECRVGTVGCSHGYGLNQRLHAR